MLVAASELCIRLLAGYLRHGLTAAIYVRGSFGRDEPVFGLSDVDLIAVMRTGGEAACAGEDPCRVVSARWRRLERRVPLLSRIVEVKCYLEPELLGLTAARQTYGLRQASPRSLFFAAAGSSRRRPPGVMPYLWPMHNWRPISRCDLRPAVVTSAPDDDGLLAWADLQYWWQLAFATVSQPETPWAAYACVKLVAEPARILLWLEHGEQHFRRRCALRRALELLPEEAAAIGFASALLGELHRIPLAPLDAVLPCFVRLSARIAQRLATGVEGLGTTAVALQGVDGVNRDQSAMAPQLPLCDWSALVQPPSVAESWAIAPGRCEDPAALAEALGGSCRDHYPTLLSESLFVRPSLQPRGRHRTVAFAVSDPISAALVAGSTTAAFANAPGWCAADTAARAVTEHRAWLRSVGRLGSEAPAAVRLRRLSGLLCAARAALFLDSVNTSSVAVPVTFAATVELFADRLAGQRRVIEEAGASYRAAVESSRPLSLAGLESLTGIVKDLDCYH